MLRVVIVGRPNVGKSSLFNVLSTDKKALVHETPGVTRDVREASAQVGDLQFMLLDTAGLEDKAGDLADRMNFLTRTAVTQANVVLFVIDGRDGVTPVDESLLKELRATSKPVLLVVNKADVKETATNMFEAQGLGFGDPVVISATHRIGFSELEEALKLHIQQTKEQEEEEETGPLKLAIVGRPNAGKSTLVNTLLGDARMLTGPEAGLTRESIGTYWKYNDTVFELIDTPGIRKKAKVIEDLEQMSVGDALHAVASAKVVVLLIDVSTFDPTAGEKSILHQQDAKIAAYAVGEGKPLIIALNKWDIVADKKSCMEEAKYQLTKRLSQVKNIPLVHMSAVKGKNLHTMLDRVVDAYGKWQAQIGTGMLNKYLDMALEKKSPPLSGGKPVRLKYVTQVASKPPTFAVWGNRVDKLPNSYKRFLMNELREAFGLDGIVIRMEFKGTDNPYATR